MAKYLLRPEFFLYFSIVVLLLASFILRFFTQGELNSDLFEHYFQITGNKILFAVFFLFVIFFTRFAFFWLITGLKGTKFSVLLSRQNLLRFRSSFFSIFQRHIAGRIAVYHITVYFGFGTRTAQFV